MKYRQLRPELQERVRLFVQYKWLASRGVNEESILQYLPTDLHREIQRHLCLALVRWEESNDMNKRYDTLLEKLNAIATKLEIKLSELC
ncbi:hypothetical protein YC2023_035563 [Brassica napus]